MRSFARSFLARSLFLVAPLSLAQCSPSDKARDAPIAEAAPAAVRVDVEGLTPITSGQPLVTAVAFVDYDCPYSARLATMLDELGAEYGRDLGVVVAPLPLPMHPTARAAARALLAAAEQGRAAEMHARLFATQGAHGDDDLRASARAIGLDVAAFDEARESPRIAAVLARAEALAATEDVTGTPTVFMNGRRVDGAQPRARFEALVDAELVHAGQLLAKNVLRADVYRAIMSAAAAPTPRPPAIDETFHDVPARAAPSLGPERAPVDVVVFGDFECPYCARLDRTLRELREAYPTEVRVVYREHPLPMHPHARLAAKAALAADRQGLFAPYHETLFAHQDALDRASLVTYAGDVGADVPRFTRDLDDPSLDARVDTDAADAERLDARGTPTTFVAGHAIAGAQPLAIFRAAVENALAR